MTTHPAGKRGFTFLHVGVAVAAVSIVAGGGYWALSRERDAASHGPTEIGTAAKASFDIILTANGELAAKKQTELRNTLEMESSISEVVEEGKFVKKGDQLVKLNDDEIQKQKDAETLEFTSATSEAVSAEKGYEIQEIDNRAAMSKAKVTLDLARLEYSKWEAENAAKHQELELALRAANEDFERVSEKYEKAQKLFKREFLSADELKQDKVSLIEADSKLKTAEKALQVHDEFTQVKEKRKLQSEIDEAEAEVERVTRKNDSELSSKKAAWDKAKAELSQRQQRLDKLNRQLEACIIKAPTDGLVVYATSIKPEWYFDNQGPIAIGRKVHPNETIIVLPDTTEMLAQIKIHESLVGKVKPGQKATIKIDAAQGKVITGEVESVGIMAQSGGWSDPNLREYEVKIALKGAPEGVALKPSMRCEAQVTTQHVEDVMAVPLPAVFSDGARTVVYAIRGSRYQKLPVKIGRRSDTQAEVLSGLAEGEKVLLREPAQALVLEDKTKPGSEPDATKPPEPGTPADAVAAAKPGALQPESAAPKKIALKVLKAAAGKAGDAEKPAGAKTAEADDAEEAEDTPEATAAEPTSATEKDAKPAESPAKAEPSTPPAKPAPSAADHR